MTFVIKLTTIKRESYYTTPTGSMDTLRYIRCGEHPPNTTNCLLCGYTIEVTADLHLVTIL